MRYLKDTVGWKLSHTVVSLGKFDGIHIGHQLLIHDMLSRKADGLSTVVFSFSVNPGVFLSGKAWDVIFTEDEKKQMFQELGVDTLISYPFNKETASMEPERFIRDILAERLGAKVIVVGKDFCFGHNRKGNTDLLKSLGKKYGYETAVFEKVMLDGCPVSSSRIRDSLKKGDMDQANRMLGRPYSIKGIVEHGNEMGRKILSMPTINLYPKKEKLLPPNGVYLSGVFIDGKCYRGITNIGYKPTIGSEEKKGVETYLYDFDGDLYGIEAKIELYEFIRKEQKFQSLNDLKKQMHLDREYGRTRKLK